MFVHTSVPVRTCHWKLGPVTPVAEPVRLAVVPSSEALVFCAPAAMPANTNSNGFVVSLRSLFGVLEERVRTCTKARPPHGVTPGSATPPAPMGTAASPNEKRGREPSTQSALLST